MDAASKLFKITQSGVTYSDEALLLPEFLILYEQDKSTDKSKFVNQLRYIFLMVNWKSPYGDYSPEEKKAQCMEDCGFKEKDLTLLEKALVKYDQIQNKNIKVRMILDIKNSLHKFMEYFGSFNMTEKIEKGQKAGQFVHSPKEFMDVIKNVKNLFDNIEEFEETLRKEMKADPESRGQNVLGYNERA